ncbi:MAG: hypothetical protein ABI664_11760 [bacterium]
MHAPSRLHTLLVSATLVAGAACSPDSSVRPAPTLGSISIAAILNEVFEDDVVTLHAEVRDAAGRAIPNAPVQWSSADTTRLQITPSGVVTALKPGAAQVTARSGSLIGIYTLAVNRLTVLQVSVLGVPDTLASGDVALFGVRVQGEGAREVFGRAVTLASSNPAVALIDPSGRIRGVGAGRTTITASVDGVVGTSTVVVAVDPAVLALRDLAGNRLPTLVAADSASRNGVIEYHEVYLEWGDLQLSGGATPRYVTELHYAEYAVTMVGGQRRLALRAVWDDRDHGLVQYDARGDLTLTSEVVWPLSHVASGILNGFSVQYRIAGSNDVLSLFFRREPK